MSMDLDFWRYKEGAAHDDQTVYERVCCDGEDTDLLEELPIAEVLSELEKTFPKWTKLDDNHFESPSGAMFEISHTPKSVRFDCYDMTGDEMNVLIDIMRGFGCPLYDPQVSDRFDGWTDR